MNIIKQSSNTVKDIIISTSKQKQEIYRYLYKIVRKCPWRAYEWCTTKTPDTDSVCYKSH